MSDDFGTRLEPRAPNAFEPIRGNFQTGLPPTAAAPSGMPQSGVMTFSPTVRQPEPVTPPMNIQPMPGSSAAMAARAEEIQRHRQQELGRQYFRLVDASVRRELTDDELLEMQRLGRATALERFADQYLQHAREALAAEKLLVEKPDFAAELLKLDQQTAAIDAELQGLFQKLNEKAAPIHAERDRVQRAQLARINAEQTLRSWQEVLTCSNIEVPIVDDRGSHLILHPRNEMGRI